MQEKKSIAKPVSAMSVADVCQWLESAQFGECVDAFRKASVDGANLKYFNKAVLRDIGVRGPMVQVKVLTEVEKLLAGVRLSACLA